VVGKFRTSCLTLCNGQFNTSNNDEYDSWHVSIIKRCKKPCLAVRVHISPSGSLPAGHYCSISRVCGHEGEVRRCGLITFSRLLSSPSRQYHSRS